MFGKNIITEPKELIKMLQKLANFLEAGCILWIHKSFRFNENSVYWRPAVLRSWREYLKKCVALKRVLLSITKSPSLLRTSKAMLYVVRKRKIECYFFMLSYSMFTTSLILVSKVLSLNVCLWHISIFNIGLLFLHWLIGLFMKWKLWEGGG